MGRFLKLDCAVVLLALLLHWVGPAHAAGPVETSPYAEQDVEVDITDTNAAAAKNKALLEAQMRAFVSLAQKLGNPDFASEMAKLSPKDIVPLLKSLSIEEEKISPGRYEGKFTVRFFPDKIKPILVHAGFALPDEQGPPFVVVPVWAGENATPVLWEDNPWRKAWLDLNAQQAQIPLIIPLGDPQDSSTLNAQDALNNDPVKLEALRRRYDVKTLLVAFAEPAPGGGIHARMTGISPLGKITIDKVYTADSGVVADSANLAAQRFQQLMLTKFRSDQSKLLAAKRGAAGPQTIAVAIPFGGPAQWNGLRARILSTPGVVGLDVTSLDGQGAAAKLAYSAAIEDVQISIQATGLHLLRIGNAWVIQPI